MVAGGTVRGCKRVGRPRKLVSRPGKVVGGRWWQARATGGRGFSVRGRESGKAAGGEVTPWQGVTRTWRVAGGCSGK